MTQTPSTEAAQWFHSAAWKNGLALDADARTNIQEFYHQYTLDQAAWDKAFEFLKDKDLQNLEPGRYSIDGDKVNATVSEAPNMALEATRWEAHRKHIDIQYVIKGREKIGITSLQGAILTEDYDESRDISFYDAEGELFLFEPAKFFLFFPDDVHRPGIMVDDSSPVKK